MVARSENWVRTPGLLDVLVCVVDDYDSVRESMLRLLRSRKIPAEGFASAQAYLDRKRHEGPSCILLDVHMPGLSGLELQRALASRAAQIVFVTGHGDVPTCVEAMKAGAVDFLTKPVDEDDLFRAVESALARSAEVLESMAKRSSARALLNTLTPKEFEVMRRVIAGTLNKQIADQLSAAEKTIKIHRARVMEKMKVVSVPDLVRVAQAAGVAPVASDRTVAR